MDDEIYQPRNEKEEVILSLEPTIEANMHHLATVGDGAMDRRWWPHSFFDFLKEPFDEESFRNYREECRRMEAALWLVFVGNEITEDGLPNYVRALTQLFPDPTGTSSRPAAVFPRRWAAEEWTHGTTMGHTSLTSGCVDMSTKERISVELMAAGMETPYADEDGEMDIYKAILYPAVQEPSTATSHTNTARRANRQGAFTISRICGLISRDERGHGALYMALAKKLFELDPERAMLAYLHVHKTFSMPAKMMTDGTINAPTMFNKFALVSNEIGIYGLREHSKVLEDVNESLGISTMSVSGEAAKAQEYISELPVRGFKAADKADELKAKRGNKPLVLPPELDWLVREMYQPPNHNVNP